MTRYTMDALLRGLGVALILGAWTAAPAHALTLKTETVNRPSSTRVFPGDGPGAKAANSFCLMCHSAGMVMTQPDLSKSTWLAEVNKMKHVMKAPIPEDQVPVIAEYLYSIKGRK
ncbi:MAG: cytochrome c [Thiomonas sp.]|uniref:cytochrome c n=1 Tax=Thiomonas sp. TaxID=2047785 RepID=UPI002A358468|nr:cytochrome c [Thiomonas sp.]MDY0330893.1 cytochrome c [Thiomonas sp.]